MSTETTPPTTPTSTQTWIGTSLVVINNDTTELDQAAADLKAIISKSSHVPTFKTLENSDHINSGFSHYTKELTAFLSLQPISLPKITRSHGQLSGAALPPQLDKTLWYLLHLGFRDVNVQDILHEVHDDDEQRGVKTWHLLITHFTQRCYSDFIALEHKLETLSRCPCPHQEAKTQVFEDWSHNFKILARTYKETHALANDTILCIRVILHLPDSLLTFKQGYNDKSDATINQMLKDLRTHWFATLSSASVSQPHTVLNAVGNNPQVSDDLLRQLLDIAKRTRKSQRDRSKFCEKCGKGPHRSSNCKSVKDDTRCNACNQTGHISTGSLCPKKE